MSDTSDESYELNKVERERLLLVLTAAALAIGLLFYGSMIPVVMVIPFYRPGAGYYSRLLLRRRRKQLSLQFKDLLNCLSASFAVGRHMEEALAEARKELRGIYQEQDCIIVELERMLRDIRERGITDIKALEDFARRAAMEDVDIFVQVYRACRETGGDLAGALNKSAEIIGEKMIIENEIRTMAAQKKYEGRIITAMPVVIILFLRAASPEYLEVMYETLAGRSLMTMALAATFGAYLMIERITDIEI